MDRTYAYRCYTVHDRISHQTLCKTAQSQTNLLRDGLDGQRQSLLELDGMSCKT